MGGWGCHQVHGMVGGDDALVCGLIGVSLRNKLLVPLGSSLGTEHVENVDVGRVVRHLAEGVDERVVLVIHPAYLAAVGSSRLN